MFGTGASEHMTRPQSETSAEIKMCWMKSCVDVLESHPKQTYVVFLIENLGLIVTAHFKSLKRSGKECALCGIGRASIYVFCSFHILLQAKVHKPQSSSNQTQNLVKNFRPPGDCWLRINAQLSAWHDNKYPMFWCPCLTCVQVWTDCAKDVAAQDGIPKNSEKPWYESPVNA